MQGSNRIFNSLRHCIHFALFSDILVTDNSIDGSFYTGEILVVILLQSVRFGNGCIYLCVISILVLQGSNGILDSLCHCIYLALLGNILVTDNGIHSGFYSREVLVVVLVQCICFGNGCINLCVICILVLQGSNGILYRLRHSVNFALFSDVLVTDNSIDGSFHGSEVLVVVLVQCVCLSNGFVNLSVVGR